MQVKLNELRLLTFFVAISLGVAVVLDAIDTQLYFHSVTIIFTLAISLLAIANFIHISKR